MVLSTSGSINLVSGVYYFGSFDAGPLSSTWGLSYFGISIYLVLGIGGYYFGTLVFCINLLVGVYIFGTFDVRSTNLGLRVYYFGTFDIGVD